MDVVPAELAAFRRQPAELVLGTLQRAAAAGLIEAPRGVALPSRFPHAIGRQALLDQIHAGELPALHARAATTLESLTPPPHRLLQRLAHHYANAVTLGYRDKAVEYTARAAQSAASSLAHDEAARRFEQAAELDPAGAASNDLLLSAARNWRRAADFARARGLSERVFAAGGQRLRLEAAMEYEEASWRPGISGGRAVELLNEALADPRPQDPDDNLRRIEALAALARATSLTGRPDEARAIAAIASTQARAVDDEEVMVRVLRRAYLHSLRPAGLREAYALAGELWSIGRARPAGLGEDLYAVPHYRAAAAYVLADRAGLDEADDALAAAAERSGTYWRYWHECLVHTRHFVAGNLEQARKASRRAAEAESSFLSDANSNVAAQQLYMIKRERGELGGIRLMFHGNESPQEHWGPGLLGLYTEFGMLRPAQRVLGWLIEHDRPSAHESAEWPAVVALMTEAALFLADHHALRTLRPLVAEYAGMNLSSGYLVTCFGAADRYLGQIDTVLEIGDPGMLFDAALDLDRRLGANLHAAYTRAAASVWLRTQNVRSSAGLALAKEVRAEATAAGWPRVVALLDHALTGRGRRDGLTTREIEILRLLDEGLSNQAIASTLCISGHTAANHVRSILMKTSSTNRSQAVRYARDEGLL